MYIHRKVWIAMYKDDNMIAREGCNEALLRMMIDGRGNDPSQIQGRPSCDGNTDMVNETWGLASHPLASVYAPLQSFGNLYDLDTALKEGTIFTELNLPFMGRRVDNGGKCCG